MAFTPEELELVGQATEVTHHILTEVLGERIEQEEKWGEQNHLPFAWLTILMEEVGEVAQAALKADPNMGEHTLSIAHYRKELIQVAAVAVATVSILIRGIG